VQTVNWEVFRAYDIRGIYPTDIDEEAYYRIAKAYVYLFKPKTMVVGMDARSSSPPLKSSLIKGFLDAGVDIVDIGEITTDMLYYALLITRAASLSLPRTIPKNTTA
jgi:phosphomannomutase